MMLSTLAFSMNEISELCTAVKVEKSAVKLSAFLFFHRTESNRERSQWEGVPAMRNAEPKSIHMAEKWD